LILVALYNNDRSRNALKILHESFKERSSSEPQAAASVFSHLTYIQSLATMYLEKNDTKKRHTLAGRGSDSQRICSFVIEKKKYSLLYDGGVV